MSINVRTVQQILTSGGVVKFNNNNLNPVFCSAVPKMPSPLGVFDQYRMARATFDNNAITMTGVEESDLQANAINIVYEDNYATTGSVGASRLVYSDSFSGCVFYLYRGPMGYIHAVHASRASGNLADPSSYFAKRGGTEIHKWDSQGALSDEMLLKGWFGAVIAVVNHDQIDVFSVALKGDSKLRANRVMSVLDHTVIASGATEA
ncbi:hypothetical protein SIN8267_02601 [Sinobacterium norvegicum]|uniref:Uncharacterized protein n=1 Tax=Sinobacterium norvegicum TaxID=1641715 RepID=A0ABM9AHF2_9GAMM|nr:hypothetical protein [Sinobacterium norvegicum]CAH0992475.1 hypothetical protein SIN8267_02601 [Sinobacterium norvegicum]